MRVQLAKIAGTWKAQFRREKGREGKRREKKGRKKKKRKEGKKTKEGKKKRRKGQRKVEWMYMPLVLALIV